MRDYDAIIVLGGGIGRDGSVREWVIPRLDKAMEVWKGNEFFIITTSRSVYRQPVLNKEGFQITEARAGADYLIKGGVPPEKILLEEWSTDTMGNAYFTRMMHTDPSGLPRLLIITSKFHMPRSRWLFEKVFGLVPMKVDYRVNFLDVPDIMDKNLLEAKVTREKTSLERSKKDLDNIESLSGFHRWLFREHGAYAYGRKPDSIDGKILDSY